MTATKTAGMIFTEKFLAETPVKELLALAISDLVSQIGYRLETEESVRCGLRSSFYKLVPKDTQE